MRQYSGCDARTVNSSSSFTSAELGADVDERRQRGPVAVAARIVATGVGDVEQRVGAGARARAARRPGRRAPRRPRGARPGPTTAGGAACCETNQLATPVEHGDVLGEEERAGRDAEPDGEQHAASRWCRASTSTRRTPARARSRRASLAVRTPASRRSRPCTRPRAPRAGWRRRWWRGRRRGAEQVPPAGELAVERVPRVGRSGVRAWWSTARARADDEDRERRRGPGARPTHTGQSRRRTERAERVREEGRAAAPGSDEAAGVDDARQRRARRPRSAPRARTARGSAARRCHACGARAGDRRARERQVPCGRERRGRRVDDDAEDAAAVSAAGWVSTTTTPMPVSAPRACSVSGSDPAEHRDDEVDAPVRAQVLEHDRQPVALVGPDGGERSITSWRGSPPVPSTSPALVTTSTRRRSRTRRATTDAAASTATSNDSASCAPGCTSSTTAARERQPRLVLADHQLAGARGRAPVHAAQVVADLVVAQRDELVAEVAHDRARRRSPRARR